MDQGRVNPHKVGQYLKKQRSRIVGGFRLENAPHSQRTGWRVAEVQMAAAA